MSNELATADKAEMQQTQQQSTNISLGFMVFDNLDNAIKCAEIIAKSGICPTDYRGKPNDVLVAVQFGQEVGLTPLQALQNIAVINGRPTIWGDAMLALCKQKSDFEYITETFDTSSATARCVVKRRGEPEHVQTFGLKDAQTAGLSNKSGPWKQYPNRMCTLRARGFALRNVFPHHLKGLKCAEEVRDEESLKDVTAESFVDDLIKNKKSPEPVTIDVTSEVVSKEDKVEDVKQLMYQKGAVDYVARQLERFKVNTLAELDDDKLDALISKLTTKKDVSQADALASQLGA